MEKKIINAEDLLKNRSPEQILNLLETELKNLIQQKKSFKAKFQNKFQEVEKKLQETKSRISEFQKKLQEVEKEQKDNEKWFRVEWQEATKWENKMILLWDYWQREVEILTIQKKLQYQVLSTERQGNVKKLDKLIALNAGLEKGNKEREIAPELMEQLRKKIGAWEE
jgi:hypothetical protein